MQANASYSAIHLENFNVAMKRRSFLGMVLSAAASVALLRAQPTVAVVDAAPCAAERNMVLEYQTKAGEWIGPAAGIPIIAQAVRMNYEGGPEDHAVLLWKASPWEPQWPPLVMVRDILKRYC